MMADGPTKKKSVQPKLRQTTKLSREFHAFVERCLHPFPQSRPTVKDLLALPIFSNQPGENYDLQKHLLTYIKKYQELAARAAFSVEGSVMVNPKAQRTSLMQAMKRGAGGGDAPPAAPAAKEEPPTLASSPTSTTTLATSTTLAPAASPAEEDTGGLFHAVALQGYKKQNKEELQFDKGDVIYVLEENKDEGTYKGRLAVKGKDGKVTHQVGWFPSYYVQMTSAEKKENKSVRVKRPGLETAGVGGGGGGGGGGEVDEDFAAKKKMSFGVASMKTKMQDIKEKRKSAYKDDSKKEVQHNNSEKKAKTPEPVKRTVKKETGDASSVDNSPNPKKKESLSAQGSKETPTLSTTTTNTSVAEDVDVGDSARDDPDQPSEDEPGVVDDKQAPGENPRHSKPTAAPMGFVVGRQLAQELKARDVLLRKTTYIPAANPGPMAKPRPKAVPPTIPPRGAPPKEQGEGVAPEENKGGEPESAVEKSAAPPNRPSRPSPPVPAERKPAPPPSRPPRSGGATPSNNNEEKGGEGAESGGGVAAAKPDTTSTTPPAATPTPQAAAARPRPKPPAPPRKAPKAPQEGGAAASPEQEESAPRSVSAPPRQPPAVPKRENKGT